ncbi:hypothetical protein PLICRDRAFT_169864 [Plicaturopsis crispa FD-325 SS-3]|nr:hypothetical protein PLICRDRAFT_169864 [Plicaturopsis crispa FD-325 SS-3]
MSPATLYAQQSAHNLKADPDAEYDEHVGIVCLQLPSVSFLPALMITQNLSELEPRTNGFDLAAPISKFTATVAPIGSCTNSSYEDMSHSVSVAKDSEAAAHELEVKSKFTITSGSEECVCKNVKKCEKNSAVTTNTFVASPGIVTAFTLAGSLSFSTLTGSDCKSFRFSDSRRTATTPARTLFSPPPANRANIHVSVDSKSERLQLLQLFQPWDDKIPNSLRPPRRHQGYGQVRDRLHLPLALGSKTSPSAA